MTLVEKFTLEQDGCFHMMCVPVPLGFRQILDIWDEIWNAFKMFPLFFFTFPDQQFSWLWKRTSFSFLLKEKIQGYKVMRRRCCFWLEQMLKQSSAEAKARSGVPEPAGDMAACVFFASHFGCWKGHGCSFYHLPNKTGKVSQPRPKKEIRDRIKSQMRIGGYVEGAWEKRGEEYIRSEVRSFSSFWFSHPTTLNKQAFVFWMLILSEKNMRFAAIKLDVPKSQGLPLWTDSSFKKQPPFQPATKFKPLAGDALMRRIQILFEEVR